MHRLSGPARRRWYRSYVQTITQRDVRTFSRIHDGEALPRLLRLLAARTSQELNLSEVPKALSDPLNRALGPLLETFVAGELGRKITWSRGLMDLYHFRAHNGPEVDLILEARDGRIAAVEVKASSMVQGRDFKGPDFLVERLGDRLQNGVVLYLGDKVVPCGPRRTALPLSALWSLWREQVGLLGEHPLLEIPLGHSNLIQRQGEGGFLRTNGVGSLRKSNRGGSFLPGYETNTHVSRWLASPPSPPMGSTGNKCAFSHPILEPSSAASQSRIPRES